MSTPDSFQCDLVGRERDEQARAWKDLVRLVRGRKGIASGFRITFDPAAHDQLEVLVAIEQRCCGWANWSVIRDGAGSVLEVTGPDAEIAALAATFGL